MCTCYTCAISVVLLLYRINIITNSPNVILQSFILIGIAESKLLSVYLYEMMGEDSFKVGSC